MDSKSTKDAGGRWTLRFDWLLAMAAVFVLVASLVYLSPDLDAMNYFDPPKRVVWALLAALLAIAGLRTRAEPACRAAIPASACALLLWMTLRTIFRPHPTVEFEVLMSWLMPLAMFILGARIQPRGSPKLLAALLLIAVTVQAGLMCLEYVGHDPIFRDTTLAMSYHPGRMIGTIGYQNQAVDFLVICGGSVLLYTSSIFMRFLVFALLLGVAVLTANRGGIVACVAAIAVSQAVVLVRADWQQRKWRIVAICGSGLVAFVLFCALIPVTAGRFREAVTGFRYSPAAQSRILMGQVAVDMFRDKPWAGWGAGEYAFQYLDRLGMIAMEGKAQDVLRSAVFAREAHNDYLQFAAEFGITGVALAILLIVLSFRAIWSLRSRDPAAASFAIFISCYMALAGAVSFPWQASMAGPLAGLLLGYLVSSATASKEEQCPGVVGRWWRSFHAACGWVMLFLVLIMLYWHAENAYLNTKVLETLYAEGPVSAEEMVPAYAYRYHAIVGAAYAENGDYEAAYDELQRAYTGYRDVALYNNLGHVLAGMGRWKEARLVYEGWVGTGIGVSHSDALYNLSVAYEQTREYAKAVSIFERKLALWPSDALDDIKRLAVLQLQAGDPGKALKTLLRYEEKCTQKGEQVTAEMDNLAGAVYRVLGRRVEAKDRFLSALEKNPELESAQRNLDGLERAGQ